MFIKQTLLLRIFSFCLLFVFLNYIVGCTYYKARQKEASENPLNRIGYYSVDNYSFVIHFGDEVWQMTEVKIYPNLDKVIGSSRPLNPLLVPAYKNINPGETKRYLGDKSYIRQVHLYIDEYEDKGEGKIVLSGPHIEKAVIYSVDGFATTLSFVGTATLTLAAALSIYLLIACNCPHVYADNGNENEFVSTLFTGATSPGLERTDYKVLPDYFPNGDQVHLKIVNEEPERQFTNQLNLLVAYHKKGESVAPDRNGNIHLVTKPIAPLTAFSGDGRDQLTEVQLADNHSFNFDARPDSYLSEVYVTFPTENYRGKANLILNVKNSKWGGYVYKDFLSKFGSIYARWSEKNQTKPGEEARQWAMEQGILLSVEYKKGQDWVTAAHVDLVGDAGFNTVAIPIDLGGVEGEIIEIRLASGYKFWELDQVSMDYEDQLVSRVDRLLPDMAAGNGGEDFSAALSKDDNLYMEHLTTGSFTEVVFRPIVVDSRLERTLIIHSKGYYTSNFNLEGAPQVLTLRKFKRPGELSRHSMRLFEAFEKTVHVIENVSSQ